MNEAIEKSIKRYQEDASNLLSYYACRRVGHTYTMLHGALNTEAKILVPHVAMSKFMNVPRSKVVSLENLDSLRGLRAPLAWDNPAIITMLSGGLRAVSALQMELEKKDREIQELRSTLSEIRELIRG